MAAPTISRIIMHTYSSSDQFAYISALYRVNDSRNLLRVTAGGSEHDSFSSDNPQGFVENDDHHPLDIIYEVAASLQDTYPDYLDDHQSLALTASYFRFQAEALAAFYETPETQSAPVLLSSTTEPDDFGVKTILLQQPDSYLNKFHTNAACLGFDRHQVARAAEFLEAMNYDMN